MNYPNTKSMSKLENDVFWNLRYILFRVKTPKTLVVDGKTYTVNQGFIFRGNKAGGKKVDFFTLFQKGLLDVIANMAT